MTVARFARLLRRSGCLVTLDGFRVPVIIADADLSGSPRVAVTAPDVNGRPLTAWVPADCVLVERGGVFVTLADFLADVVESTP